MDLTDILVLSIFILVAAFYRAGFFSWSTFWPLALGSIPFAFFGGFLTVSTSLYKVLVGLVLLFSAFRLLRYKQTVENELKKAPLPLAYLSGTGIGFLSGLTGVGGGIFLSPLLLFTGWADAKKTSGISAAFILVNSVSGLLGHVSSVQHIPGEIVFFAVAALIGGIIGTRLGTRRVGGIGIRRLLAVVLINAGLKMMFTNQPASSWLNHSMRGE
ncbi:hypothetical protein C8P63_12263 [Melghirimyces profundicolus]|uniref:Probable membrane transporter protein n=1 Tax=Melghirimyces profundicolus TaxID=1242148 RepID=A0A2T6BGB0_9BACL|nr:sulfite exporter TauE/SafE family protein [Melghirimyces profundicolus]PTX55103.1 hypothetical protein C8P63_12263 [Melghirimyces profundicolus]